MKKIEMKKGEEMKRTLKGQNRKKQRKRSPLGDFVLLLLFVLEQFRYLLRMFW